MGFFERHDRFFETSRVGTRLPGGDRSPRLTYRYEAIIGRNRAIYQEARVLDLASHDGRWSLAALDAGAATVIGIEGRHRYVAAAYKTFAAYNVDADRYTFLQGDVPSAMGAFDPGSFDLILCLGIFYHSVRHYEFFDQFYRLGAGHIILDTEVDRGEGALIRFRRENDDGEFGSLRSTKGLPHSLVGIPSYSMIEMLCDYFRFTWRVIDWRSFGIEKWDGIEDYRDDRRRTYVLTRVTPNSGAKSGTR